MKGLYTAEVTADGGRFGGRARSADGRLDLAVSLPGQGEGTNPEELFAAGYAACFGNALILAARRAKADPEGAAVTALVTIGQEDDGAFGLEVELRARLPRVGGEEAEKLVRAAHETCPYSRATRGNVDVRVVVE